MFTSTQFWASSLETAVRTAAAAALGVIGAEQLTAIQVDWTTVAGVALLAAIVSILTSVAVPNPDIRAVKREAKRQEALAAEAEAKKAAAAAKRKAAKK
jgi:hypothetical protein